MKKSKFTEQQIAFILKQSDDERHPAKNVKPGGRAWAVVDYLCESYRFNADRLVWRATTARPTSLSTFRF